MSSISLMPRDENEILSTESRASRRDREFCSSNLEIRDEIENFQLKFLPLMCYLKLHLFIFNKYIFLNQKISKICISSCVDTKQISAPPPPPAFPLGRFSKYSQTRLVDSMKSYSGMRTIQLQYIQVNFHFCPTCLKTLC